MSATGVIQTISEGGVSGNHPEKSPFHLLVGPSTNDEFNLARLRIVPIACWRVDDLRFQFDSSVVLPDTAEEMRSLAALLKAHPGCPLSVFGHADPVGSDDYNKTLSGRRAIAIYAMLTRNAGLWDHLFTQPFGGDKWGDAALGMMSDTLTAKGQQPPAARQQLFLDYMDAICGPGVQLAKTDFLGQGADANGKADYQGCSEFNPLLIFSAEKEQEFDDSSDTTLRNAANAPNRRVLILMFRKGSRVDPAKWPCPRATEGTAGCVKRFFSDGDQRRNTHLPGKDRKFEDTKDTFGCRFFDRLTSESPCHRVSGPVFRYGLEIGDHLPWDDSSTLRIVSQDGAQERTFTIGDGAVAGVSREFVFSEAKPGVLYKAEAIVSGLKIPLFDLVELFKIQDPADPLNVLPLPPAAPHKEEPAVKPGNPAVFSLTDPGDLDPDKAALPGDWFDVVNAFKGSR